MTWFPSKSANIGGYDVYLATGAAIPDTDAYQIVNERLLQDAYFGMLG